jgi:hypothetical protein
MGDRVHAWRQQEGGRNWGFFLALGLCVGFWIIVTTAVAQAL